MSLLLLVTVAPAVLAEDSGTVLRIFDVRQLLNPVPDCPGPSFSLVGAAAVKPERPLDWEVGGLGLEDEAALLDDGQLLSAIREWDPAVDWDGPDATLQVLHGRLYAKHEANVLKRLDTFLQVLEREAGRMLCVRLVAFGPPFSRSKCDGVLTPEAGRGVEEAVRKGAGWYEEVSVTGLNGQRVHASKSTQFLHLSDFNPEVAAGATMQDPVMAVGELGVALDVRPLLSPSGDSVGLTLRLSCALPVDRGAIPAVQTPSGKVQTPSARSTTVRTTVSLRPGGFVLFGTTKSAAREPESRGDALTDAVRFLIEVREVDTRKGR
jgi:hypothetical protein